MNIVFMGSPEFALPSLEKIHQSKHTIKAVVSNKDKRRGRGSRTSPTPVKARALELKLPVIDVEDLNSDGFEQELKNCSADLFVVVAFRILPQKILDIPAAGSINLHASLLPKYRGAAPIHWAIINGEKETGCTVFFLDEKVDTGNIISQKKISIEKNETTGELYERLREMGSDLLLDSIDEISRGDYSLSKQNHDEATPAPKLFKEDCHLDFNLSAEEVRNKISGLSPFPTAWAEWNNQKLNIYRSKTGTTANKEAGELFVHNNCLFVACASGTVELLEVQLPGTKRISGEEFIRGYEVAGKLV